MARRGEKTGPSKHHHEEGERRQQRKQNHDSHSIGPCYPRMPRTGEPEGISGREQGTFINIKTGEVRTYFANPPQTNNWRLLSPRLDITPQEARELVAQGGYGSLAPEQVHF